MPGSRAAIGGQRRCPPELCNWMPVTAFQPCRQASQTCFLPLTMGRSGAKLVNFLGMSFGSFLGSLIIYLLLWSHHFESGQEYKMEGKNVKKIKKPKMGITKVSQLVVSEYLFLRFLTINLLFFSLPSTVCALLISVPPPTSSQTSLQELNRMHLMARSEMQLTFGPHTHFSPPSLVTWFLESNFGRSWQNSLCQNSATP